MPKIPTRLEDLLPVGAYEKVIDLLHRPDFSGKIRDALGKVGLKELNPLDQVQDAWQQAKTWIGTMTESSNSSGSYWINATGQLFGGCFAGCPSVPAAALSGARSGSAFQSREQCLARSAEVMQRTLGGQYSHTWLADPLSALQIVSRSLGSRCVIARADCNRIVGLGDVRAMLAALGNAVIEVGASNGASAQDWSESLHGHPDNVVVIVSPCGLPKSQWNEHRRLAIQAAKASNAKVVEVLADGSFNRSLCESLGFPHPVDRLGGGSDVVLVPAGLLTGGPGGWLCVGAESFIQPIASRSAALSADLDCARITANLLAIQLAELNGEVESGLVGALAANPENLRNRCQRLAVQLQGVGKVRVAEVNDRNKPLGVSPWDRYSLSNAVVSLQIEGAVDAFEQALRQGSGDAPSIQLGRDSDCLYVDLRFVTPDDDHHIASVVRAMN